MRRLLAGTSSGIVLLLLLASVAAAEPPLKFPFADPPVDSGLCSFPVLRSGTGTITSVTKPDGTAIVQIDRVLTFSANGKTLTSNDHFTRFFDPTQPTVLDLAGHVTAVQVPGQGAILLEVGRIIFDAANPGPPIFEAGQHSQADGNTEAFCAYFSS